MEERAREISGKDLTPEQAEQWRNLRCGWCLGSDGFREKLMDLADGVVNGRKRKSYKREGLLAHDQKEAARLLAWGLAHFGMSAEELIAARKSDAVKQALAWLIKSRTMAGDEWVSEQLGMGDRSNVSRAVAAFRSPTDPLRKRLKRRMHICTG
jgi:hypothetical protein